MKKYYGRYTKKLWHKDGLLTEQERNVCVMYIDEKVDLRDNLPTALQYDFEELQEYYEAGDWFMFDTTFEVVEASVKAYYLAGKITRDDLNCIFRRYGID